MNSDQVFSAVRSVLLAAGTAITVHGIQVFSTAQWEAVVGGLIALGVVAWSQITHAKA